MSVACRRLATTGLVVLLNGGLFLHPTAAAEPLRTGGTGAALGTLRVVADAITRTDPRFTLEIIANLGSSGGVKALERDAIHFAVIGRPLSREETAKGLEAFEYGRTPFVLATAKKGVGGLTLAQIAEIYAGRQTHWPDGTPIRLILRPSSDIDTSVLAAFSPAIKEAVSRALAREGLITATTDQDSANEIGKLNGALGTASLSLILSEKRSLHALPIDGAAPTVKALAAGTYPYSKPFYIVTRGKPSGATATFVDFLRSAQGQRILAETGHWVPGPTAAAVKSR